MDEGLAERKRVLAAGLVSVGGVELGGGVMTRSRSVGGRHAEIEHMRLRRPLVDERVRLGGDGVDLARYRGIDFAAERVAWRWMGGEVRREIAAVEPEAGRWTKIVVHGSGMGSGDLAELERVHREVRGLEGGAAYHFVIGNGRGSGLGEVEVGRRWREQREAVHGNDVEGVEGAIAVCLVGDFQSDEVELEQLEALDELIDFLRGRVGEVPVVTHRQLSGNRGAGCLGGRFPEHLLPSR